MTHRFRFLVLALPLFLGGCAAAAVTAGAGLGVSAVQEGGLQQGYEDLRIQTQINEAWFAYDVDMFSKIDMTVSQGRVLLTGVVENPEHRVEAVRLAWQPEGVKQVINEIRVSDPRGFGSYAKDTWITTRIRTSITFDSQIQSINYSIDTVNGTVYLIGTAQSQAELDRVVNIARKIPGVGQVVSYVKMTGQALPDSNNAQGTAPQGGYQQDPYQQDPYQPDQYQQDPYQQNGYQQDQSFYQPPPSDPYNGGYNSGYGGDQATGAPTDIQAEPLSSPF